MCGKALIRVVEPLGGQHRNVNATELATQRDSLGLVQDAVSIVVKTSKQRLGINRR
jgi:hypothetical protein